MIPLPQRQTHTMHIDIRTISDDEFDAWSRAEARGFSSHASDEYVEIARSFAELDRTFGAFDGAEIVGTTTTRTSAVTVPGGPVALGFVDDVSVHSTHRRRGILTQMMRAQLDQMHERGEPLAALSASESMIYGRFGFGVATWADRWSIDRRHTAIRLPANAGGRVTFMDPESARREWPTLHKRVRQERVGMVHYNAAYWGAALWDSEWQRRGAGEFFHVSYIRDGHVAGLCTYRIKDHDVLVVFLLGEDDEIEAELWQYCFGIDLMSNIYGFVRPVDDPLPWRLEDMRGLRRTRTDHMWLRLIDVKAALQARQYDAEGSVTLGISDSFCPWNDGVYTLEVSRGGVECAPSGRTPDVNLNASDLAAVYLGGVSFSTLAGAGRIEATDDRILSLANRLFRIGRAPWFMEL